MKSFFKVIVYAVAGVCLIAFINPGTVFAKNLMNYHDNSWISISGTVAVAHPDYFWLDYGKGMIRVEMDDWDWYAEGRAIKDGDEVIVYGRIDDDLYENKKIEAGSVYVKGLNTYFYASDADEEGSAFFHATPLLLTAVSVIGKVTAIDGREFTIDTNKRKLQVDTSEMRYNPMDDKGFQKIRTGDVVRVSGDMDYDLFEKKELMADSIITLFKDKTKKTAKK